MNKLIINSNQDLTSLSLRSDIYNVLANQLTLYVYEENYRKINEGEVNN